MGENVDKPDTVRDLGKLESKENSVLREDWLASSAVVALGGVFLLARALQLPEDERQNSNFLIVPIPAIPDIVVMVIAGALFVLAFMLVLSSIVPMLSTWPLQTFPILSPLLWFFVWFGFTVSWASSIGELPDGRWWWEPLAWSGLVMSLFILYKAFRSTYQLVAGYRPTIAAVPGKSHEFTSVEPQERADSQITAHSSDIRSICIAATTVVALVVIARAARRPYDGTQ